MQLTLTIDFGSTFTKIAAFDLDTEELVSTAQAKTTVETDITHGLQNALDKLQTRIEKKGKPFEIERMLSSSSAAGGLRMIAAGLTKALTTKAAREAVLGAGAKLIAAYSHKLTPGDINEIEEKSPDLILLSGGTDGGNEEIIIKNAHALSQSRLQCPIIIAGNRTVAPAVAEILVDTGKDIVVVENILPDLDRLNIEPARGTIREIFIRRITHAKGLDKAREMVGDIIMPTPMAVLKGAALLGKGTENESGWGDLMVIDVGGATTDVHSIGYGHPADGNAIIKGLPESFDKRTVEGDLGIRYNAPAILEKAGKKEILKKVENKIQINVNLETYVRYLSEHVDHVPRSEGETLIDRALAAAAVETAVRRHAGKIEEIYFPTGKVKVQYGKDLTGFARIIGTGGILAHGDEPGRVLESSCFAAARPESLCPRSPEFFVDQDYILFAAGLLSEIAPSKALRIMKKHLTAF
ncbi:MAG: MutL protein, partial [bacterium]|nr:MutL protein [bacterium]